MDFNAVKNKIWDGIVTAWRFIAKYWSRYHVWKLLIFIGLQVTLIASMYLVYLAKTSDVSTLKAGLATETVFYDRDGQEAGSVSRAKGTFVSLDQIAPVMQQSLIATEDKRFYQHKGVDPMGIARAAVGYVTHFGKITGGGSTLTQQLAKNAYLTLDQTLIRKAKELFLALEIERQYSKDEILEMYLNHAYFGNGVYGVEDASKRYFGKSAIDLSLSEAATLTGMLKGPSIYNPIDHYENAIARRNVVLDVMATNGVISSDDAQAAKGTELALENTYVPDSDYTYPYYFDAVIDEAIAKYGLSEEAIMERGYRIYTTMDQATQQQMTQTYSNSYLFPDASDGTKVQSASVAMDPTTGGVLALMGGRDEGDEHVFRGFNRATQMRVQPGSTLKPLSVYTAALENGYDADSMLQDEKTSYGSDNYTPENWNYQYQGEVTMSEALAMSWNAPAVWLLDKIGIDKGLDKLKQFGIPITDDDRYLGIALGGMTKGVSPMMMASAYTTFANQGIRSEGYLIQQIVDANGNVVVSNRRPTTYKVTTPKVAEEMTSMLLNVYTNSGTGANAQSGYQMAGKTGTTETVHGEGSKDQWMIAYTPDIVVTTWLGFDETNEQHHLEGTSENGIAPLFRTEMASVLPTTSLTAFGVEPSDNGDNGSFNLPDGINDTVKDFGDKLYDYGKKAKDKIMEWFN